MKTYLITLSGSHQVIVRAIDEDHARQAAARKDNDNVWLDHIQTTCIETSANPTALAMQLMVNHHCNNLEPKK